MKAKNIYISLHKPSNQSKQANWNSKNKTKEIQLN